MAGGEAWNARLTSRLRHGAAVTRAVFPAGATEASEVGLNITILEDGVVATSSSVAAGWLVVLHMPHAGSMAAQQQSTRWLDWQSASDAAAPWDPTRLIPTTSEMSRGRVMVRRGRRTRPCPSTPLGTLREGS